ncbi:hypothetical protein QT970_03520 [Microcoleus sp. herbarium8]|uniref:hypothetical protein n=1 Tax=Microcoleus sp. herbarium8 TaxID=3055436 RepID=UPI002FCF2985
MDSIASAVLEFLAESGSESCKLQFKAIAQKSGVSAPTVALRLEAVLDELEKDGKLSITTRKGTGWNKGGFFVIGASHNKPSVPKDLRQPSIYYAALKAEREQEAAECMRSTGQTTIKRELEELTTFKGRYVCNLYAPGENGKNIHVSVSRAFRKPHGGAPYFKYEVNRCIRSVEEEKPKYYFNLTERELCDYLKLLEQAKVWIERDKPKSLQRFYQLLDMHAAKDH